jgi:segregation and condensation protein B
MPDPESLPEDSAVPDSDMVDMDALLRLAEAMIFAATAPVTARQLGQLLPNGADSDAVLAALQARYAGRGVELVEVGGGWQFCRAWRWRRWQSSPTTSL